MDKRWQLRCERVCAALVVRCPSSEGRDECNSSVREIFHAAFHQKYIPEFSYSIKEHGDTASRGPTTIVTPKSQFRTCPSDHDSIGYPRMKASGESSTTKHRLLHASGPHPIPPPNDPKHVECFMCPSRENCESDPSFVMNTDGMNRTGP
ncbi:phytochrome A-like [Dorcoceras hygrometricum]|uniref:Phytochrome A-like n=1 Tax=Dorcoceras hygrometricum TaxID=472368 RepID=A0A2Z7C0N2_9LAMI|nr:phytochrome A-like [Dorcoceras hygrometricum]